MWGARADLEPPVTTLQRPALPAGGTTAARTPAPRPPGQARTALLLGAIVAVGPLTIDMYLPALPTITDELRTTSATVQLTLTGTLVGLALGQLVLGPLADALGRRRPLIAGTALLVLGVTSLRETLPPERRSSNGVRGTLRAYGGLFRDRAYVGLVLVAGLTMAALFAYVSGSSFVYQEQFGLDEQQFGLLFGAGAFWLIAATQLNPVLLRWASPAQVLVAGTVAGAAAGVLLLVLAATGTGGLFAVAVPLWAVLFACGLALPNA